ncbi:MAG: DUF6492 family protein [bacterium]|nr:DUF6492 family protein [bacterium]
MFAILIKSHAPDLPYVERLLASCRRHNRSEIPVYLVVPDADLPTFARVEGYVTALLADSQFADHLTETGVAGFSAGYINQEIIKLCFWESGLADNYLCLDSDAEFIRDFTRADFMADERTPYTFVSEDARLQAEPEYYRDHWVHRDPRLRLIQAEIGMADDRLLTVHGQAVFSAAVLRSFRDDFLATRSWDYVDALAIAPYEPTWYSLWLQQSQAMAIIMREPIFKTFHNAAQHIDFLLAGITRADAARGYVGVIVNSNYSRGAGVVDFGSDRATNLAAYVPESELLAAAARGAVARTRRLLRPGSSRA